MASHPVWAAKLALSLRRLSFRRTPMGPNRSRQERARAAERKAAAEAREVISRAERSASRTARPRWALIRDVLIAITVACVVVGAWELFDWLASIGMSNPDARAATGLMEK
jgi:hypothetical protein